MDIVWLALLIFNAGVIFGSVITIILVKRIDNTQIDQALDTVGIRRSEFEHLVQRMNKLELKLL